MTSAGVKRLFRLAAEARAACIISLEDQPCGAIQATIVTADGSDVIVWAKRSGERWEVGNADGDEWYVGDVPDAMVHAIGEAMGDE